MHPMFTNILNAHFDMPPTRHEMDELERAYDGPIPAYALHDLRNRVETAAQAISRARVSLHSVEMNVRSATKELRDLQDRGASDAAISNASNELELWLDELAKARAALAEVEALAITSRAAE